MRITENLKENWKDLVVAIVLATVFSLFGDWVDNKAATVEGMAAFGNLANLLQGLAKFTLATSLAWISLSWIWPEWSDFMTSVQYDRAMKEMPNAQKMVLLVAIVCSMSVVASLCFFNPAG